MELQHAYYLHTKKKNSSYHAYYVLYILQRGHAPAVSFLVDLHRLQLIKKMSARFSG